MPEPLTILLMEAGGGIAGSTQSVFSLAVQLTRRGHRVLVGTSPDSHLDRMASAAGLERPALDFSSSVAVARDLRALLARERIDVVNPQSTVDRRASVLLRWSGQLPMGLVVTRRTMPLTWPPELMLIGATADRTIAVSKSVADALVRRGHPAGPVVVVPNGIDLARVDATASVEARTHAEETMRPMADRARVLVVARRKDQDVLLRAAPMVRTPMALVFAGIEADPELAALAAALPERHQARFLGLVTEPLPLYAHATLAALPSRIEGLSQALLEAMALGVPVLASRAGGNPDLIKHDHTGWKADPTDPADWALQLDRILADESERRRVAAAARNMVRTSFTLEHTADRTEAVYRAVLDERSASKHRRRSAVTPPRS